MIIQKMFAMLLFCMSSLIVFQTVFFHAAKSCRFVRKKFLENNLYCKIEWNIGKKTFYVKSCKYFSTQIIHVTKFFLEVKSVFLYWNCVRAEASKFC